MSTAEFGQLLNSEYDFLSQLAFKLTRKPDDAEDLIQDTYYKALKNKDKFSAGTNLKGWLYTIMRNTFINNYRRKKNQNTFHDETESQYFLNSQEAPSDTLSDSGVDNEYIMNQIDSIEKHYTEAFFMHYNGYKYEEIAEKLDIPLGTVKSRIFLARKKMMEKLADQHN
jgi:RNA polymerase sigma-70 factor (ECF subfamily)